MEDKLDYIFEQRIHKGHKISRNSKQGHFCSKKGSSDKCLSPSQELVKAAEDGLLLSQLVLGCKSP